MNTIKQWHIKYNHQPSLWITTNKGKNLISHYSAKTGQILDVGSGSGGELLTQLKEDGFEHLNGVDMLVPEHTTQGISILKMNLAYDPLPFKDESMDLTCSFETFEHLENPRHAVREIFRVTKSGGVVIISVPNILSLYNRLVFLKNGEMYRYNLNNDHWSMFPRNVFEKTFLPYFELVDTVYLKGYFPYGWLTRVKLPENKWFARSVCWVFKRREKHLCP